MPFNAVSDITRSIAPHYIPFRPPRARVRSLSLALVLASQFSATKTSSMSDTRRFKATDLFEFNNINLDSLTETFNISFYLSYMSRWPNLCVMVNEDRQTPDHPSPMGYIMGKSEGKDKDWHTHVTAITVAPSCRQLGIARKLMDYLERAGDADKAYFVDLFVRPSNLLAVNMYKRLGYSVYRRVLGYYSNPHGPDEDSFDMRKALSRDVNQQSIRKNGEQFTCKPEDTMF
ncbi:NatB N-acetyltransferase complex catalytic subunit Nat3 [Schizosaccharomyces japonicus yFS275]|uniref:NatB N-acetyltransferase complex catalytic subunit Nat3 n=1 Tax=Schizosaccharomyces japonicus (strain yFS275 / FY16936) TaxID=402676 RepID=B6JZ03_SCHJY|nr:NatB N-acetyltransferase complex catalytic subunit Nat3 [Schizosaccharomyces japonicus yFS275]EEB06771.2 NatB N-acetyltransferase complex catalytic subunit Nat3 [Schizosaccharomyces japonicus yFS275]